jgi:multidrug efflux pump subunit AcrB
VKAGVFSSFITTVCVLGPLALLEGDIGSVLEVVPLVLILVLVVSLVEAFCILPAHLAHALHHYEDRQAATGCAPIVRPADRWDARASPRAHGGRAVAVALPVDRLRVGLAFVSSD